MVEEMNTAPKPAVEKNLGGRPPGSTNARTRHVARMIEEQFDQRGSSLIGELVDLAMSCKDDAVRSKTLLGLSRYVYPTLTAIAIKQDSAPQTAFLLDLGGDRVIEVKPEAIGSNSGSKSDEED